MKKIPKIYWLFLFVFSAGLIGIFYNYGMIAGGVDESLKIQATLKFFRDFSLKNEYSTFLPMTILSTVPFAFLMAFFYFIMGVGGLNQLKELAIADTYKFVPYFRLVTIIFGLISIYVFYKICLLVFKRKKPAILASYFLATSLIFIQQLHIAGAWIQQTMMILLSIYYFLTLLKKEKWSVWVFIISALLIVFSFEIELVGLIAIMPFFLIYRQKRKEIKINNEVFKLFLFFSVIILSAIFFAYLDPATFWHYFSFAKKAANTGLGQTMYGQGIFGRFSGFFEILFYLEPLLFILFFCGLITAYKKDKFLFKIFGSYGLVYYLTLGPLMAGVVERRALPMIPVLAVFAAFFIDFLLEKYKTKNFKKFLSMGLLIFLLNPILFDRALLKKSSYIETRDWITKNIPANASIFDMCWLEINENKEILGQIKDHYPNFFTTRRKYLLDHPDILESQKAYFVVRENEIAKNMKENNFQYLIVCYSDEEQKQNLLSGFQNMEQRKKIYDSLAGNKNFLAVDLFGLVKFSDLKNSGLKQLFRLPLPYQGPHFEIYE